MADEKRVLLKISGVQGLLAQDRITGQLSDVFCGTEALQTLTKGFIVRHKPYSAEMEAWTDCPKTLSRGLEQGLLKIGLPKGASSHIEVSTLH